MRKAFLISSHWHNDDHIGLVTNQTLVWNRGLRPRFWFLLLLLLFQNSLRQSICNYSKEIYNRFYLFIYFLNTLFFFILSIGVKLCGLGRIWPTVWLYLARKWCKFNTRAGPLLLYGICPANAIMVYCFSVFGSYLNLLLPHRCKIYTRSFFFILLNIFDTKNN